MSEHKESHIPSGKTAAKLFVECLENEGVEVAFGLPGEENADFVMALGESKQIRFVLVRHEQGAAFMADAYGRLLQQPAVCFGTLGPGATNLVTGVADGNMDRVPMIVVTGQADTFRLHKESHQNMDVVRLFTPIVKWSTSIFQPASIPEIVRKAFKIAKAPKKGACHIELPEDVASADTSGISPILHFPKVRRSVPDDKSIDQVWKLISTAKKPVLLVGNGVFRSNAVKQLVQFVKSTNIPVLNTFMGKGAIPRSMPQCVFTVGLGSGDYNNALIHDSDLVVTVGFDMVEYHPKLWNSHCDLTIAHIDLLPAEVDTHYHTHAEAVGDISHSLWMLNERQRESPIRVSSEYYQEVREKMWSDFEEYKDDNTKGVIKPQKILYDVREVLGDDDILLSDVGAHKMWIARYYQCESPNTCLISNGFCSMGFALPGAIGAKIAYPDRNILAICGDGGFLMNSQEMETAKRLSLNIVVLVWVDGGYGLIAWKQDTRYGKHTELEFENPDFVLLAKAFGWEGYFVEDAKDLKSTIEKGFASDGPVLIACNVDYSENPKLTARLGKVHCHE